MIETNEIHIKYAGDQSVGIFPASWVINGPFSFDTESDFDEFKKHIRDAFEFVCDQRVGVYTIEEIRDMEP